MKTQPISAHHELPAKAYPNESPDLTRGPGWRFCGCRWLEFSVQRERQASVVMARWSQEDRFLARFAPRPVTAVTPCAAGSVLAKAAPRHGRLAAPAINSARHGKH